MSTEVDDDVWEALLDDEGLDQELMRDLAEAVDDVGDALTWLQRRVELPDPAPPGTPSVAELVADARAAWQVAKQRLAMVRS